MAMRLTGLMSGMDTESIIQELVSVKRTKVDTVKKTANQITVETGSLERSKLQDL